MTGLIFEVIFMSQLHTVGAFQAKTHFADLLNRVVEGEQITITRHGKAIARLLPIEDENRDKHYRAAAKIKELKKSVTVKNKA